MKSPLIFPFLALMALGSTTIVALSQEENLEKIEIYFYDKEKNEKRIKFSIAETESTKYLEYYDKNDNEQEWKRVSYAKDETAQNLYPQLYLIAKQYIKVQHALNLVKAHATQELNLENICKDQSKCCCNKGSQQCDCDTSGSSCLCCYADNTATQNQASSCCCNGTTCTWNEFKKTQKTFNFLLANMESYWRNQYLQPVQAHIKLTDVSFSELETNVFADSTDKQIVTEYKPFIASLSYSFVDFYYKHKEYQDSLPKTRKSEFKELTEGNKDIYFTNIPHRFKFKYLKLDTSSTAKPDTENEEPEEPKDSVSKVWEDIKDPKTIYEKSKEISGKPATECCCCDDKETEPLDCIIKKNFVFLETENTESKGLAKIQKKVKESSDCCSANKV